MMKNVENAFLRLSIENAMGGLTTHRLAKHIFRSAGDSNHFPFSAPNIENSISFIMHLKLKGMLRIFRVGKPLHSFARSLACQYGVAVVSMQWPWPCYTYLYFGYVKIRITRYCCFAKASQQWL